MTRDRSLILLAAVCVVVAGWLIHAGQEAAAIVGLAGVAVGRVSGATGERQP